MKILNVGSGNRPMPHDGLLAMMHVMFKAGFTEKDDYTNIDRMDLGQDHIIDLEDLKDNPLPFKDNEFDHVMLIHVFEHIQNVIPLMDELWRVTKNGGKCYVVCPYWTHFWAVGDIDHKRLVNEHCFIWFNQDHYTYNKEKGTPSSPCMVKCDWTASRNDLVLAKDSDGDISELRLTLTCRK